MGDDFFDKLRLEHGDTDPPRGAFLRDRPLSLLEKSSKLQAAVAEPLFAPQTPGGGREDHLNTSHEELIDYFRRSEQSRMTPLAFADLK